MIDFSTIKKLSIDGVNLRELYIDNTKTWQASRLPAGYTEVKYIETDGNSWIDTGVNAYSYNDKTLKYRFKGNVTRYLVSNGNNYLWGCLDNNRRSGNISLRGNDAGRTYTYIGSNSAMAFFAEYVPDAGSDFEIVFEANSNDRSSVNGDIDGNSFEYSAFTAGEMPEGNIWLGYCSGVSSTSKAFAGKIYSFITDTTDGTPILSYVPCIRDHDGNVGMFDLVTGTFFGNAGTGAFTAGPVV